MTTIETKLKHHNLTHVKISNLKFDKHNPNTLTEQELNGLRQSMKKFGYLTPIITDKKFLIADGEHRVQIYKEFGLNEIPAYVLDLSEKDRRMLRQTMNKLRGTHDLIKDAQELSYLADNDALFDLSILIAQNETTLTKLIDEYNVNFDNEAIDTDPSSRDYKEIDSLLPTENKCPKCGYQW